MASLTKKLKEAREIEQQLLARIQKQQQDLNNALNTIEKQREEIQALKEEVMTVKSK